MKSSTKIISATVASVLVLGGGAFAAGTVLNGGFAPAASASNSASGTPVNTATASTLQESLAFIIEEEKLAFDVYTVLGEKWDLNSMQNITNSESTHQSQVEPLLVTYGVDDPRSSEVGVFTNPDLQALYDSLISTGMTSKTDAIEVGVLIEETDIADIDKMLTQISEPDVVSVLQSLRSGSLNHLVAFQRQL